ncbi:PILS2 [Symbiodinium sp. CCMP2456]|nr:PILS2 [Symbiodinium sp. CCMP2456]
MGEITMKLAIPALLFSRILYCDQCNTGGNQCAPCQPFVSIILSSWILFVLPMVVVGLGVLLGKTAAVLTSAPSDFSRGTVCAVAFGNSTGLPIVLLSVISLGTPATGSMGSIDPLLRLPVYLMLYPVLQWGVGRYLLKEDEDSEKAGHSFGFRAMLEQALVPPVIAALLGLVIGVSPVRAWMVDVTWLYDGIYKLGDAAVPLNLLVLGSALSKGANFEALPIRVGVAIVLCKLVLMPLCMSLIVYGLIRIGPKDASLWLVALIVSCTPTANNVAVMAESGGQNKDAMSTAIFLQYLVAPLCVATSIAYFNMLLSSTWYLPAM